MPDTPFTFSGTTTSTPTEKGSKSKPKSKPAAKKADSVVQEPVVGTVSRQSDSITGAERPRAEGKAPTQAESVPLVERPRVEGKAPSQAESIPEAEKRDKPLKGQKPAKDKGSDSKDSKGSSLQQAAWRVLRAYNSDTLEPTSAGEQIEAMEALAEAAGDAPETPVEKDARLQGVADEKLRVENRARYVKASKAK